MCNHTESFKNFALLIDFCLGHILLLIFNILFVRGLSRELERLILETFGTELIFLIGECAVHTITNKCHIGLE